LVAIRARVGEPALLGEQVRLLKLSVRCTSRKAMRFSRQGIAFFSLVLGSPLVSIMIPRSRG
jgi:hypothetical protein